MTMALQVFSDVMALLWQHPVFSCLLLLLFTPPFFPIVRFFSPLLISTALFMLALFTMGPQTESREAVDYQENWEFRRAADVKVWEDKSVGNERKRLSDGTWMDWLSTAQETSLAWIDAKLRNENWKGSALNDDNVSILQEASWPKSDAPSTSEEVATETKLARVSITEVVEEPAQLPVAARIKSQHASSSSVHHEPLVSLQIPKRAATVAMINESPSTDLEDSTDLSARLLVRRNSVNASSGVSESDIDTPAAVAILSKSGRLKQIETLGDLIEHAEEVAVLKPTTADQVDDVKDKLENFTQNSGEIKPVKDKLEKSTHNSGEIKPVKGKLENFTHNSGEIKPSGSPLFKARKTTSAFSDDDSSGDEVMLSDDSDSESDFEIFPPADPKKMKLHPPVKLDIKQLEIKLGTSLTPPKGEITEVQ